MDFSTEQRYAVFLDGLELSHMFLSGLVNMRVEAPLVVCCRLWPFYAYGVMASRLPRRGHLESSTQVCGLFSCVVAMLTFVVHCRRWHVWLETNAKKKLPRRGALSLIGCI
eukprot:5424626-Amphidinium_carterae.2